MPSADEPFSLLSMEAGKRSGELPVRRNSTKHFVAKVDRHLAPQKRATKRQRRPICHTCGEARHTSRHCTQRVERQATQQRRDSREADGTRIALPRNESRPSDLSMAQRGMVYRDSGGVDQALRESAFGDCWTVDKSPLGHRA